MAAHWKILMVASAAVGIAACTPETTTRWNSEAGSWIDEGGFGNPTMFNMMAQMCSGKGAGYKLGSVSDPVVKLDPNSPITDPRYYRDYRGRCHDQINGKYANVIFREYVRSAQQQPGLTQDASQGALTE